MLADGLQSLFQEECKWQVDNGNPQFQDLLGHGYHRQRTGLLVNGQRPTFPPVKWIGLPGVGFREALEVENNENEEILQKAFDEGYAKGFRMATEFNTMRFTAKLVEGMYENKRLVLSCQEPPPLLKLRSFNSKLDELQTQITQSKDAMQCFNQLVNIDDLKGEAKAILRDLECPIML